MLANMKSNRKMPLEVPVQLRYLHQEKGVKMCELLKREEFACYSKSNVYLHAKQPVNTIRKDQWYKNKGRPQLLSERDNHRMIRAISTLWNTEGSFSARRLKVAASIDPNISDYTVRRSLNQKGYRYLQSRRKGLMSQKDIKNVWLSYEKWNICCQICGLLVLVFICMEHHLL